MNKSKALDRMKNADLSEKVDNYDEKKIIHYNTTRLGLNNKNTLKKTEKNAWRKVYIILKKLKKG